MVNIRVQSAGPDEPCRGFSFLLINAPRSTSEGEKKPNFGLRTTLDLLFVILICFGGSAAALEMIFNLMALLYPEASREVIYF
jgi:hypothetical protein